MLCDMTVSLFLFYMESFGKVQVFPKTSPVFTHTHTHSIISIHTQPARNLLECINTQNLPLSASQCVDSSEGATPLHHATFCWTIKLQLYRHPMNTCNADTHIYCTNTQDKSLSSHFVYIQLLHFILFTTEVSNCRYFMKFYP